MRKTMLKFESKRICFCRIFGACYITEKGAFINLFLKAVIPMKLGVAAFLFRRKNYD